MRSMPIEVVMHVLEFLPKEVAEMPTYLDFPIVCKHTKLPLFHILDRVPEGFIFATATPRTTYIEFRKWTRKKNRIPWWIHMHLRHVKYQGKWTLEMGKDRIGCYLRTYYPASFLLEIGFYVSLITLVLWRHHRIC